MEPIALKTVLDQGDVLDTNRQLLTFTRVDDAVTNEMVAALSIRGTGFVPPQANSGTTRVGLWNQFVNFSGAADNGGHFNMSFYETDDGKTTSALMRWRKKARDPRTDASVRKRKYAVDCLLEQFDTTGAVVIRYKLINVFPVTVTPAAHSEQSAAYRVDVVFSVDFCDVETNEYTNES